MTNKKASEKRRKRQRIRRIRMAIKIAVYVLFAAIAVGAVWGIVSLFKKDDVKVPVQENAIQAEVEEDVLVPDESEDAQASTYVGVGGKSGWNVDENGWWYLNDDETVFTNSWQTIDGNTYYFDENGYMLTGWHQVDGKYYFFKPDGTVEAGATEKLVCLTYDDGPSNNTDRLLECLVANGAKATFFVVGEQIEYFPDVLKRIDEAGMEIGSHTYDHPFMKHISGEEIQETMRKNEDAINELLGHGTAIMRPTGGGINDTVRANVFSPMILWDLDTEDWDSKDVDSIVDRVLSNVQDGSVILMHDLYEATVKASEIFIPELVSRGYRMVTVSEMAELRGVTLEAGKAYESFYLPTVDIPDEEGEDEAE